MKVLITGISRGIGAGLVEEYLNRGDEVYGIGRSCPFDIPFYKIDLTNIENLYKAIDSFDINFDLAVLNAGILGEIKLLKEWSVKELQDIFMVNVWSNKVLVDLLDGKVKKIVIMSSGAAVNGNPGWGGYALSKCAVNMMVSIYSKEINTPIFAVAPGVIDTDMVRKVISADRGKFSSVVRVDKSRVELEIGVERLVKLFDNLDKFESGSFIDIRNVEFI
ncbi:benzil reductase ((S)-benzoin forming) [Lebetimonas natsushimae]|uniref:Benzil reductase ((S)-benzoin forming) n=1 Tax=Lebetimonas natsushimae TaxID=1936991 RepID=A0A292Y9C8_9BACT|nr:SDR family NAD(P)-dependent oxidoreductase [Lebetimonas natsushimae]GAX87482.1 benzil reductase ((S)-benzoin forming) [Lebetimonas natsushimae]